MILNKKRIYKLTLRFIFKKLLFSINKCLQKNSTQQEDSSVAAASQQ